MGANSLSLFPSNYIHIKKLSECKTNIPQHTLTVTCAEAITLSSNRTASEITIPMSTPIHFTNTCSHRSIFFPEIHIPPERQGGPANGPKPPIDPASLPTPPFPSIRGPTRTTKLPPSPTLSSRHLVFLPLGTPQIFICLFAQNSSVCPYPFRTESV